MSHPEDQPFLFPAYMIPKQENQEQPTEILCPSLSGQIPYHQEPTFESLNVDPNYRHVPRFNPDID